MSDKHFYDSLIISSAIEEKCNILFSEDMHNGTVIDQTLLIVNPFKNK
jgi:predicted nucleic acid-binding protein